MRRQLRAVFLVAVSALRAGALLGQTPDAAPTITTQPAGQNVAVGGQARFTVGASGTPSPTIHWQTSTDYGSTWADLTEVSPFSGVNTAQLNVAPVAAGLNATQYRAVVTNTAGSVTSSAASLFTTLLYTLSDSRPLFGTFGTVTFEVFNPATTDTIARIPIAAPPPSLNLSLRPAASVGYVSDGPSVSVLDLRTNTVIRRISAGSNPGWLALSPDESQLFVLNRLLATDRGAKSISVVSTTTEAVTNVITLPDQGTEMIASLDGSRLYVLAEGKIFVVDPGTATVTATIAIPSSAQHLVIHPDGTKLYVVVSTFSSFGSPQPPPDNTLTVIDTLTEATIATVTVPALNYLVISPGAVFYLPSNVGAPSVSGDGKRLYVIQSGEGYRTSPTSLIHKERLFVIDATSWTVLSTQDFPYHIQTPDMLPNSGVVVATPPCWFEVWPQQQYVRNDRNTFTIDIPAAAACGWTATTPADWLAMNPASGAGAGTISVSAPPAGNPRTSTITIGGQSVTVSQLVTNSAIDIPRDGAVTTLPIDVSGWIVDRVSPLPPFFNNGIGNVELWDLPDPPSAGSGARLGTMNRGSRSDVGAVYGSAYQFSGFSLRVGRLSAGRHTLQVRAAGYDGTILTTSVSVTVQRRPAVALDLPANQTHVKQPFRMAGWALDATAPSGTGIDSIEIWAQPASGPPVRIATPVYGTARPDVGAFMADFGFSNSGFDVMVSGIPAGAYTLTVTGRSTQTGLFDATASVQVVIDGQAPIGSMDLPVAGASVTGSIAVTGWALDDAGIDRVEIWRDLVPGETTPPFGGGGPGRGKVFIATATFITGARPDVEAAFPAYPQASRAGWGYLLLTQGLWNQGNGTYRLYAFAFDMEGSSATIGTKTISVDNAHAVKPFGALDTPSYGQTVTGPFWNYGWALTPKGNSVDPRTCTIPSDGVQMAIDSGPLVPVNYGDLRPDIAAAFPGFSNGQSAGGATFIDTTTLSNGTHQIGWYVVDTCGRADGIGSRFFTVQNGGSVIGPETGLEARDSGGDAREPVAVRRNDGPSQWVWPGASGTRVVTIDQHERVTVALPSASAYVGYQIVNNEQRPLPVGSSLDAATGTFYWQPAAGFLGSFDLAFVDGEAAIDVRIVVGPPLRVVVDTPTAGAAVGSSFLIAGWALDLASGDGSGIDTVHVWAYPINGAAPIFLGVATVGGARPDVAATYGPQFMASAYNLSVAGLSAASYDVVVYPHRAATNTFEGAQRVRMTVR